MDLTAEARSLVDFARASRTAHGFGWLDDDGRLDATQPVHLWITGRMTHAFALGHLLGFPDCLAAVMHGVRALSTSFRDDEHPGWYSALHPDGTPTSDRKVAYDHAFVILGAASALAAGVEEARPLLRDALDVLRTHWWDETHGMVADAASRDFSVVDPYRGVNANMHTVEVLLDAYGALGEPWLLEAAERITLRVADLAAAHEFRIPEHFDEDWRPLLEYNHDKPDDPFRPYGATPGHGFEWARLMLSVATELAHAGREVPNALHEVPSSLYARAREDGWQANGGFVYTTDFSGRPVVEQRMHWVVCEAIGAAEALRKVSDRPELGAHIAEYWAFVEEFLVERPGAWRHELGPDNRPAVGTWAGKPDIYHALQACLVGSLPLRPAFAWALAGRG